MDRRDQYLGIILAGWTMAFVLPIGGLVASLLLADRRAGHAVGMGAVSVAWMLGAWWLYVTTR
jgi:hypothetical protein